MGRYEAGLFTKKLSGAEGKSEKGLTLLYFNGRVREKRMVRSCHLLYQNILYLYYSFPFLSITPQVILDDYKFQKWNMKLLKLHFIRPAPGALSGGDMFLHKKEHVNSVFAPPMLFVCTF